MQQVFISGVTLITSTTLSWDNTDLFDNLDFLN